MEADVDADAPGLAARPDRRCRRRRRRARPRRRAAARRRAAGGHGGHRPLLGARRGGAARALRGAPDPGVPERAGARLRARRPPAVLLARARDGPEGRRRGARGRRADGLPARLRRLVRRRDGADRDRLVARPSASTRARWRRSCTAAWPARSTRCAPRAAPTARRGSTSCARPRTRSARPSRTTSPTTARRSTRCASTASWPRCSTATPW